jgi:hypothetical protein
MNLFELQERLKDFSQEQLVREMQAPTGTAPQYLVLSELQRRKRMMAESQAQMPQDQTTVAQDAVAAAGVPQAGLAGIAQAMAPRTDMDMNTGVAPVERMAEGGAMLPPRLEEQGEPMSREELAASRRDRLLQDAVEEALSMMESSPAGAGRSVINRILQQVAPEGYAAASDAPGRGLDEDGGMGVLGVLPALFARRRGVDLTKYPSRMADGGVVRMQPGGLAGISRDLGAYSPTMEGAALSRRMMEEEDARRRRAEIAAAAEPLLRFDREGRPNIEGFAADLAAAGVIPAEELLSEEGLDPRFYPTEGVLEGVEEISAIDAPVRQGAPLSARPDILMDLVPEPEVTPFQFGLGGGGGGRRGGAPSAGYTEEDLANVSPGRGGTQPVVGAPSIVELLSAPDSEGDPRSRRSRAATDAREAAAAEADAIRAAEAARMMEINEIPAVARRVSDDGEVIPPPVVTPPEAGEDVNSVVRGGGNREAAPAADDAFQQDKWLALAQFGLNLMSSQQPTFGGAIGEAGLAGITALRQARSERDERVAAQKARADRMAASAARPETDGISSTERAAYFRAANEAEAEAARLELAIARGGEVGEGGFVMNPYTEEELAILQRQLNAARSRVSVYSGLSNPSLATIQAAL